MVENDEEAGTPDLRGLPIADAVARLAALGARIEIIGSGIAVEQSPPAGAARSAVVRVTFRPPG
jgi:beta-lactam-binding protein with PASTA domain